MYNSNQKNNMKRAFAFLCVVALWCLLAIPQTVSAVAEDTEWPSFRANRHNTTHVLNDTFTVPNIEERGLKLKWRVERVPFDPVDGAADAIQLYGPPTIIDDGVNGLRMFTSRYGFDFTSSYMTERDGGVVMEIDPSNGDVLNQAVLRELSQQFGLTPTGTGWNSLLQTTQSVLVADDLILFQVNGFDPVLSDDLEEICLGGPLFACNNIILSHVGISNDLLTVAPPNGYLVAVEKDALLNSNQLEVRWVVEMDRHPMNGNGTYHSLKTVDLSDPPDGKDDVAFVGTSSGSEYDLNKNSVGLSSLSPNVEGKRIPCCTALPFVMAIDLDLTDNLGGPQGGDPNPIPAFSSSPKVQQERIIWKTYTTPMKPGELNFDGLGLADANEQENPNGDPLFSRDPYWWRGGGHWAGPPTIDSDRGLIYIATANHYQLPTEATLCEKKDLGLHLKFKEKIKLLAHLIRRSIDYGGVVTCNGKFGTTSIYDAFPKQVNVAGHQSFGHYAASIVALDMYSGDVKWSMRAIDWDIPFPECMAGFGNDDIPVKPSDPNGPKVKQCQSDQQEIFNYKFYDLAQQYSDNPPPSEINCDFAQSPMLITDENGRDLVVAGTKCGTFYAIDAEDAYTRAQNNGGKPYSVSRDKTSGPLAWKFTHGRGGTSWGTNRYHSATDGKRIYVSDSQTDNFGYEFFRKNDGTGDRILRDDPDGTSVANPISIYPIEHHLCAPLDDDNLGGVSKVGSDYEDCQVHQTGDDAKTIGGYLTALRLTDGKVEWEFAPPPQPQSAAVPLIDRGSVLSAGGSVTSPTSGADDGVFFHVTAEIPAKIYALEAKSGRVIWSFVVDPDTVTGPRGEQGREPFNTINTNGHPVIVGDQAYFGLGGWVGGPDVPIAEFPFDFDTGVTLGDLLSFEL